MGAAIADRLELVVMTRANQLILHRYLFGYVRVRR
jgi:hypothetical protein